MASPSRQFLCVAALAGALAAIPKPVDAAGTDELFGTRGGQAVSERDHHIELTFERGYARLKVRRTVHNAGIRHDEAVYHAALPHRGVATGLRTLGDHHGRDRWFAGELLDADLAAERYTALTQMGVHQPRDPALLAWDGVSAVILQVFPIAPGAAKTVEYTVDMPAVWDVGRWVIELDPLGVQDNDAQLGLSAAHHRDQLFVDGARAPGHDVALDHALRIELVPRQIDPVSVELAAIPLGTGRTLVHWRVGLEATLSSIPARARVVVGLDLSRSLEPGEVEAERRAALAYLEHFRADAEVTVLGFDHEIHMLTPGFVPASQAIALLRAAPLERSNGSDLGLALTAADLLLRSTPDKHPRRILLLTDFRVGSRLSPRDHEAVVANSGAVVHLAHVVVDEEPWLERDDSHAWGTVAASTGGVVWSSGAPQLDAAAQHAEAVEVFEAWARPLSVDFPVVAGLEPTSSELPASLPEGAGHDEWQLLERDVTELEFSGMLWGTPIEVTARSSKTLADRWAALTFGADVMWDLEPAETRELARRGAAVSPVTSYLAIEPGVRPSMEGIVRSDLGLIGKGGCGGTGSRYGSRRGVAFRGRLDRQAWLSAHANAAWLRCGGAGQRAELVIEATFDEIADLRLAAASSADASRDACVLEALWELWLPSDDFIEERLDWHVALRPD